MSQWMSWKKEEAWESLIGKGRCFCFLMWQIERGEGVQIEELIEVGKMDFISYNLELEMWPNRQCHKKGEVCELRLHEEKVLESEAVT